MEKSMLTERCGYRTAAGERERGMHTLHLTIARTGGSILAQSCQERVGDVAQLVERRNGIAEATGSTPVVSTNPLFGGFWAVTQKPCIFPQFHYIDAPSETYRSPRTEKT